MELPLQAPLPCTINDKTTPTTAVAVAAAAEDTTPTPPMEVATAAAQAMALLSPLMEEEVEEGIMEVHTGAIIVGEEEDMAGRGGSRLRGRG